MIGYVVTVLENRASRRGKRGRIASLALDFCQLFIMAKRKIISPFQGFLSDSLSGVIIMSAFQA